MSIERDRAPAATPASPQRRDARPLGAYGLLLPDLADAGELLIEAPADWTSWHVGYREGVGQPAEFIEDDTARLRSEPDGWVEIDRQSSTSTFNLPEHPGSRAMIHPFLASTASVAARWRGLQSFHAGAIVVDGSAWAILGAKGAGKSSLLAYLAMNGIPVLTDDVLVVRGLNGLAGPRCIDLREPSAAALGVGEELGVVGTRERWRLTMKAIEPEVPIGGWIALEWGEDAVELAAPQYRLEAIFASLSLRIEPKDPQGLMDLLGLPMFVLSQSHGIHNLDASATRLLERLHAGASTQARSGSR